MHQLDPWMTDYPFEREHCRKHGIDSIPPLRAAKPKPSYTLRPLEPTTGFTASAVVATIDDVMTPQTAVTGLLALHRGPDGFVPFYRKHGGKFEGVASIPVAELETMLPGMVDVLAEDGFAAVNTMFRPGKSKSPLVPGAWGARRRKNEVRWVNACLVDLDVGREGAEGAEGLTIGQTVGALIDAQDQGAIPPVSIYARSGRGMYALWCLKAQDGNAQPGMGWAIDTAERINRELCHRLEALAADRRAVDAARVIRIPGTRHSKAGTKAQYWIAAGDDGHGITYTLDELSHALQLPLPCSNPRPQIRRAGTADPIASAHGRRGAQTLWSRRYHEAVKIADAMGGIPEGRRRICITMIGIFAYRSGMTGAQVRETMRAIAKGCSPPYPGYDDTPTDTLVAEVLGNRTGFRNRLSKDALGKMFNVNFNMAMALDLQSLLPRRVEQQVKESNAEDAAREKRARVNTAFDIVKRYLKTKAQYPTGAQLARELTDSGFKVGQRTAYNIIDELKQRHSLPAPGTRQGRPRQR